MQRKQIFLTILVSMMLTVSRAQGLPSGEALPFVDQSVKDRWPSYVSARGHKAFAVGEDGAWGWEPRKETEEQAKIAALNRCERFSFPCYLFAVNDKVVWDEKSFRQALKSRTSVISSTAITLGRSTFAVPEAPWLFASSHVRAGGDTSNQVVEGYGLLKTTDGTLKAAFFSSARRSSYVDASSGTNLIWSDATCTKSDAIHFEKFDGSVKFPECLVIDFVSDPEMTTAWDKKVWYWIRANDAKLSGTTISASYVKYRGGDFVRTTYWFNPSEFGVSDHRETDRAKSPWNPKNIGADVQLARYLDLLKAWSLEMATNGRSSLEKGVPLKERLPPIPTLQ